MKGKNKMSESAASGMVALVFLILGFQIAVFVLKVVERPVSPETVEAMEMEKVSQKDTLVADASPVREPVRKKVGGKAVKSFGKSPARPVRKVESFRFDPNDVSVEDLVRLGLSPKQAESVENYRSKGGKFRKREDFAKMYVVSDTLYARLEPYIDIPKLELNGADSAALVKLKGIGPFYARKILDYRRRLGGFRDAEQMMEVEGIDSVRFVGFMDDVCVDTAGIRKIDIWHDSTSALASHPYIGEKVARRIERFRKVYDAPLWSVGNLLKEHVFTEKQISRLSPYLR